MNNRLKIPKIVHQRFQQIMMKELPPPSIKHFGTMPKKEVYIKHLVRENLYLHTLLKQYLEEKN
jgi:hypothetical protein